MLEAIRVDTHTHTTLSGHAWSTLRENAVAAARRGLTGMCLTEHGHAIPGAGPFFLVSAQKMLPSDVEGVRMFYGVEANIIDLAGRLDIDDKSLLISEFTIASLHDLCLTPGTLAENTRAYLGALRQPGVDALGHIDDRRAPSDLREVIGEAKRLGKLVEINNNSILIRKGGPERVEEVARLCAELEAEVTVASDAHFDAMIGAVEPALELLGRLGFPERLVVNRDLETFEAYLDRRELRVEAVWRERFASAGSLRRRTRR